MPGLARTISAARLSAVGWDVDPLDWSKPGAEAIARRVLDRMSGGSIILLHDGHPADPGELAAVLERILPQLGERRYDCVTVSELMDGLPGAARGEPR
jgi:peptidoglycan/xylan/chitin deacetylase (PgdA/CDA1 family)